MPIRKLKDPLRYASDSAGPYAADGPLRVLIDLPAECRQVETGAWDGPTVPNPAHVLWSICQGSPDIELQWLAEAGESGPGAVHVQSPDIESNQLPFTFSRANGDTWMSASPFYGQLNSAAQRDPLRSLETYAKAAVSRDLRAHITVTADPDLLSLDGSYAQHINPMSVEDALAAVGLYLRKDDPFLAGWDPKARFAYGIHWAAWVAVRAQLPSGWRWSNALAAHSNATGDDYAVLLFGSFFERLVRMLNHRDSIHRAVIQRADNKTGHDATEALDTFMFNVVGAFDAAAIAAHIAVGLPWEDRRTAGWQNKDWRGRLGVPHLFELFHKKRPAEDVFAICCQLRNTVHGAGIGSMVASRGSRRDTLVRLPEAEATDIVARLNRLDGAHDWGIEDPSLGRIYVDPARLVEGLVPHIFKTLDQVLRHTPVGDLAGAGATGDGGVPTDGAFNLGNRTRTCLLYGLQLE